MSARSPIGKRERGAFPDERSTFPTEADLNDAEGQRFAIGTREVDKLSIVDLRHADLTGSLDLELVPHAAFLVGSNGRIEDANLLAVDLVGAARTQLVGELMERMIPDLGCFSARASDKVRSIPAASGLCIRHHSGRELPVSVLLCPHDRESMIAFVMPLASGEHRDMRAAEVAQIVHDLKSPLATIALEMYVLGEKLAQAKDTELGKVVSRVTNNVEFLDRMVQDLLDSCAIEAGQFVLQPKPTELRTLLEHVIDRLVATRDRGRVFLEAPRMLTLAIDDLRIERVVANLLQNALKYAPKGSGIVVRLDVEPQRARISVIDAGPGMTPAETTYVFDKYRRTCSARAHEGSGLGLYVSKRIIEAHNGTIGVEAVRGVGSRFFFELPCA